MWNYHLIILLLIQKLKCQNQKTTKKIPNKNDRCQKLSQMKFIVRTQNIAVSTFFFHSSNKDNDFILHSEIKKEIFTQIHGRFLSTCSSLGVYKFHFLKIFLQKRDLLE